MVKANEHKLLLAMKVKEEEGVNEQRLKLFLLYFSCND